MRFAIIIVAVLAVAVCPFISAQDAVPVSATPVVKAGEMPLYPHLARLARIEGTVQVKVTTDGDNVTRVSAAGAHKLLLDAAEQNVKSWRLYPHKPQTFTVTFVYKVERPEVFGLVNPTVTLDLPYHVEVRTKMHTVETTQAN
jgi:hypothetical protein